MLNKRGREVLVTTLEREVEDEYSLVVPSSIKESIHYLMISSREILGMRGPHYLKFRRTWELSIDSSNN